MTTRRRTILLAPALVLVMGACAAPGSESAASDTASAAGRPPFSTVPSSSAAAAAPDAVPDAVWAAVLDDLARRLDVESIDPTVVTAEATTWNDGSLGCPEPGQMYTQALVDGYHVVLEVAGERYDYRIGRGDDVRLCENGGPIEGDY